MDMFASPDNAFSDLRPDKILEDCGEKDGVAIFALPIMASIDASTVARLTVFNAPSGRLIPA